MKYLQLVKAIDAASQQLLGRAAAVVNQALVLRNWLIGAYVVEFEQNGEDRARYGLRLYSKLAADLRGKQISGCGERMLQQMAVFYRVYPQIGRNIPQPVVAELARAVKVPVMSAAISQPPFAESPVVAALPVALPTLKKSSPMVRISRPAGSVNGIPSSPLAESNARVTSGLDGDSATAGYGIGQTVSGQSPVITPLSPDAVLHFSWTHLLELIRLDDPLKRAFYENQCLQGNWSKRQLQRQIGSLLYERTGLSTNKAAVIKRARRQEPQQTIEDLIRDPYVLEFTGLGERPEYTESDLETALLDHLQQFLLELGTGFCFEARQFRVTLGNKHDYVDLLFYHRRLRCHVLLDLKVRPFNHGDAGQMNFYLNYFKDCLAEPDDHPPVGIILCSDKDRAEVEYATAGMSNTLFVSRYLTALPSVQQLRRFLVTDRARTEAIMAQQARTRRRQHARKHR